MAFLNEKCSKIESFKIDWELWDAPRKDPVLEEEEEEEEEKEEEKKRRRRRWRRELVFISQDITSRMAQ